MSSPSKEEGEKSSQKQTGSATSGEKRKQDEKDAETQTEVEHNPKRIRLLVTSDQNKKEMEVTKNVLETKIYEQESTTTTVIENRKHIKEEDNSNEEEDKPQTKKSKPNVTSEETTTAGKLKDTNLDNNDHDSNTFLNSLK